MFRERHSTMFRSTARWFRATWTCKTNDGTKRRNAKRKICFAEKTSKTLLDRTQMQITSKKFRRRTSLNTRKISLSWPIPKKDTPIIIHANVHIDHHQNVTWCTMFIRNSQHCELCLYKRMHEYAHAYARHGCMYVHIHIKTQVHTHHTAQAGSAVECASRQC
jgi:hypothetical protein